MKPLSEHISESFDDRIHLTQKQEETVYKEVVDAFEKLHGEATNIESNFITSERNYFYIHTDNNVEYSVDFKTLKGKLIAKSIIINKK